jgi:hypothetical protein
VVLLRVGGRRTGGRSAPAPRAIRTNAGDGCGHATALFGQIPVMLGSAGADLFGQTPVKGLPPYSDKCRWWACTSIRTNTGDVLAPHPTVGQRRAQARGWSYSDKHRWWSTEQRGSIRTNAGDKPARTNIGHSDKFRWWASLRGALLFGQIPVNPGRRGRNGVFGQIPVWTRRGEPGPIRTNTGASPRPGLHDLFGQIPVLAPPWER